MDFKVDKGGFVCTIAGPRGSGKSHLIKKLLKERLNKKFKPENIFIICPSLDLNDDFKDFFKARKYAEIDPSVIRDIMDEQKYNVITFGKKRTPNVLIILDDCAATPIVSFRGILDTIAIRGRHMKISIIISTQRISGISRTIRINSDCFILFSPYNYSELEQFVEQYCPKDKRKEFRKKCEEIWNKDFNFVFVDNQEKKPSKKLKEGFDKVIEFST